MVGDVSPGFCFLHGGLDNWPPGWRGQKNGRGGRGRANHGQEQRCLAQRGSRSWGGNGAPSSKPTRAAESLEGDSNRRGWWGGGGSALHSPFLRTTSSDSGLRLTETTFIPRWFPPWRMSETTCLCPTFTTFTPFTCVARREGIRRGGAGPISWGPPQPCRQHPATGVPEHRQKNCKASDPPCCTQEGLLRVLSPRAPQDHPLPWLCLVRGGANPMWLGLQLGTGSDCSVAVSSRGNHKDPL